MKTIATILPTAIIAVINISHSSAQGMEPRLSETELRHERWFPDHVSSLRETDPELFEVFSNFAFDEVTQDSPLDDRTRFMSVMASCIATQSTVVFKVAFEGALDSGITPVEAKEVVYQSVPYVGISKAADFIRAANEILQVRGVTLPLDGQSTTSPETRFADGLAVQKEIFGERIDENYKNSPPDQLNIQRFLSANCFGDYVARGGLDLKTREMLTFSMLLSLGGCEPQLKGHIQGNANVGNDKRYLLAVVTGLIPYVGYPRALNAVACLNEVLPE